MYATQSGISLIKQCESFTITMKVHGLRHLDVSIRIRFIGFKRDLMQISKNGSSLVSLYHSSLEIYKSSVLWILLHRAVRAFQFVCVGELV